MCITEDHIRAVADAVRDVPPRRIQPSSPSGVLKLSGLDRMMIGGGDDGFVTNFVNIGERCNVAGSSRFAKFIKEAKFEVCVNRMLDESINPTRACMIAMM